MTVSATRHSGTLALLMVAAMSVRAEAQRPPAQHHEQPLDRLEARFTSMWGFPSANTIPDSARSRRPKCVGKTQPNTEWVVRLWIPSSANLLDKQMCASGSCIDVVKPQLISSGGPSFEDDDEKAAQIGKSVLIPNPNSSSKPVTPLDIDLTGSVSSGPNAAPIWTGNTPKPVIIKVILTGNDMDFIAPAGDSSNSKFAVFPGGPVEENGPNFSDMFDCRQPIRRNTKMKWVSFRVTKSSQQNAVGTLNIGVQLFNYGPRNLLLPIILDPLVPNNG